MVTNAKGHMEAFISNFIWQYDEANQGQLPVSALTLAMQLSQQAPDLHLAVGCGGFICIHLSIPDSQDKYPTLDIGQPAVGFARQTPAKGIYILPAMQESKATWCVQGNTAKGGNSQPLAVPTRQRLCSTFVLAGGSAARAVGGLKSIYTPG